MKKGNIILSIILMGITAFRISQIYKPPLLPAASVKPLVELPGETPYKKWSASPLVPNMDAIFGMKPDIGKKHEKTTLALKDKKGGERGEKGGNTGKTNRPPHLFGVFSEDGRWIALLKQEEAKGKSNGKKNKAKDKSGPGYVMLSEGDELDSYCVEDILTDGVVFDLKNGKRHPVTLFDFDRKGIRSPSLDD